MKEIEIYHMFLNSYNSKGKMGNYFNRAILKNDNNYYIGKHWIYYLYYLESLNHFLDSKKIDYTAKHRSYHRLFDMFDDDMHHKEQKNITDVLMSIVLLNNNCHVLQYKIACPNEQKLTNNLKLFDKIIYVAPFGMEVNYPATAFRRSPGFVRSSSSPD